jgi:hypothetical protein
MSNKQKLELTWIGKEKRPRLEPRILLEDAARSYHVAFRRYPSPPAPLSQACEGRRDTATGICLAVLGRMRDDEKV